jgi:hypothetical protein
MNSLKIAALPLIVAGVLGLAYGSFGGGLLFFGGRKA